jgi:hypothetical protein
MNVAKDYNAPTITKIVDAQGSTFKTNDIKRNNTGRGLINLIDRREKWIRPGDTVSLEVEVDPSFSGDEYEIRWIYLISPGRSTNALGPKLCIVISNQQVGVNFPVHCNVISNKEWHRCGDVDDSITLSYKVLPPI